MKKSSLQSVFPVLLVALLLLVFGQQLVGLAGLSIPPIEGLDGIIRTWGVVITELHSTKISSLHGVSSDVYITPPEQTDPNRCDWRTGMASKMHWPQLPDFGTTGMDIDASQAILADDFKCTSSGPITDFHFWASFVNDILPANEPNSLTFEIRIYSDAPAMGDTWSRPQELLWSRVFYPGDYTVHQMNNRPSDWFDPMTLRILMDNHRQAFQYNFCVDNSNQFSQTEGTIYWLSIRELRSANALHKLGWKTTTKKLRWNDNAVSSIPGAPMWLPMCYPKGHEYVGQSINLAFSITDSGQPDRLHDLGDAPDSSNTFPGATMLAYPDANTIAHYPTVFWTNFPPYGPIHWHPKRWFYLGKDASFESAADNGYDEDLNNNIYPPGDLSDRDGADDGIKLPLDLPNRGEAQIPYTVTLLSPAVNAPVYVNVWCDWNRDGDWDDTINSSDGNNVPEWAVQNAAITINFAGTVDLETPPFKCWHPQNQRQPDPMWLRITISEKPWSAAYPSLIGSGGSGPDTGYEYGETEDYLIYPRLDPDTTEYDWGDAPDSFAYPGYPTISFDYGANHVIAGPWLGDANDKPDAELDGQPDANAMGDNLDTEPLLGLGSRRDDENGATIPPLIPGYPADITLEVGGGGGIVQAWIDYDSDMKWQADEEVYNNFLAPGTHVISFVVPVDAVPGQSFARFRISREGNLDPNGPAKDGEVEDYTVLINPVSPYTKWLQLPDVTPNGIDIEIDSNNSSRVVADDFKCTTADRITDVHFWGSWKNDKVGEIQRIRLSIYDDDPAGTSESGVTNPYSRPAAKVLWQKDFYQNQFSQTLYHVVRQPGEWWWDLLKNEIVEGSDRQIWRIDIYINRDEAFMQTGTVDKPRIYWLAIEVDTKEGQFGWKTRRWPDHFMDDAVWDAGSELPRSWNELRYPKKHPYYDLERNSIDMAFQLTDAMDPVLPTVTPVSATQCPAVQTRCPATTTQCPPVNTRCPVVSTQCPPVQTQCGVITVCNGSSETICPAVQTQCPVKQTQCPATVTQCVAITVCGGSSETICPALLTQCPVVETQCPPTLTKCVAITVCGGSSETICPALLTQCPVIETECPPSDTKCPPRETECPPVVTKCPAVETGCPAPPTQCPVLTQCPTGTTRCPPVDTKCPAVQTQCPVMQTGCPSPPTECLIVQTECPQETTRCPSILSVCPPVLTQCTAVDTVCPPVNTKCPVEQTRCPEDPTKCPPKQTECPPETTLCVVIATQCPVETVCPAYETRCPAVETGCPAPPTQCPMQTQCPPVPTECPPNQCVETIYPPTETKCPVVITQCPVYNTWCNNIQTKCPYNQTQCPPPNPTGSCDPPPIPPWQTGAMNIISSQILKNQEVTLPPVIPVIQTCPVIDVKCPTVFQNKKLLVRVL